MYHHPNFSVHVHAVQALLKCTLDDAKALEGLLQVQVPFPAGVLRPVDSAGSHDDVAWLMSRRRRVWEAQE